MGINGRLKGDDRLVGVQSFTHLLRNAEEAIVGEVPAPETPESGSAVGEAQSPRCLQKGTHGIRRQYKAKESQKEKDSSAISTLSPRTSVGGSVEQAPDSS